MRSAGLLLAACLLALPGRLWATGKARPKLILPESHSAAPLTPKSLILTAETPVLGPLADHGLILEPAGQEPGERLGPALTSVSIPRSPELVLSPEDTPPPEAQRGGRLRRGLDSVQERLITNPSEVQTALDELFSGSNRRVEDVFIKVEGAPDGAPWINRLEYARDRAAGFLLGGEGKARPDPLRFPQPADYIDYVAAARMKAGLDFEAHHPGDSEFVLFANGPPGHIPLSLREARRNLQGGHAWLQDGKIYYLHDVLADQWELEDFHGLQALQRDVWPRLSVPEGLPKPFLPPAAPKSLSLPAGEYPAQETLYVLSNEGPGSMLWLLKRTPRRGPDERSLHVGFAGLLNLDIMAARRSQYGLLLDYNPKMAQLYRTIERVLKDPAIRTPAGFLERFLNALEEKPDGLYVGKRNALSDLKRRLTSQLRSPESWLSDQAKFDHVQAMFREDRVAFFTMSLYESEKFALIGAWMRRHALGADTIYLSNIYDWFDPQMGEFGKSLAAIVDPRTLMIEAQNLRPKITLAAEDPRVSGRGP